MNLNFYNFKANRTMFPRGDDNYGLVSINFNFNYFTELYISTNGYIFFGSNSSYNSGYSICALYYDLDTRYNGGIYYENLNSQSTDFNSIKSDLNRLNSSFVPTYLFRISYENVPTYFQSSYLASFQIILARDASKSYVLLKYTSCLSSSLSILSGIFYLSLNGQQMSLTISNPCTNSSVNLAGTWVFDVTLSKNDFV